MRHLRLPYSFPIVPLVRPPSRDKSTPMERSGRQRNSALLLASLTSALVMAAPVASFTWPEKLENAKS
jgi:hypothetical protein